MQNPKISIVVAISAKRRALGKENKLLWHIPDDMKRFKELTMGHPVIMGRKTFESILGYLGKPLPGRTSIVLTRDNTYQPADGVLVAHSPTEALEKASSLDPEEIFIGGGAELYVQMLPQVNRLYLTLVDDEPEADAFFPEYEREFTKKRSEETREYKGILYRWIDLER